MSGYLFSVALCIMLIGFIVQLMRKRRIREKYAGIWIAVAGCVVILGAFPGLARTSATLVGVTLPVNLVFALAILILLIVCIQLSVGVSTLDEQVRTLTEELALLRLESAAGSSRSARPVETPDSRGSTVSLDSQDSMDSLGSLSSLASPGFTASSGKKTLERGIPRLDRQPDDVRDVLHADALRAPTPDLDIE